MRRSSEALLSRTAESDFLVWPDKAGQDQKSPVRPAGRAGDVLEGFRGGQLWLKLALHECLRYLELGLGDHGLQKRVGEKTVAVVTTALHDFSIGQVYNFIWRAVRDAAAYYMRGGVAKQQAANTVVRAIERSAEQALANGWDVKSFHRDRRAPEPVMVQTFAALVTGLGDAYWNTAPNALGTPTAAASFS